MNLAFLDSSFNVIKYFKFINLQWIRRYYSPGEFSVQIPATEYEDGAVYVYTKDRPEVGIIQQKKYADGYDGEVIQLSGYFFEYKLNDKVTFPRYQNSGNIEALARDIVSTYKDDIPILQLGSANDPLLGDITTKESTGEGLATTLYEMLQPEELSLRCVYDYEANTMSFEVWQGLDRTQEQATNSFVVFSDGFRNIQNLDVVVDSSNFKNYAVVIGNGTYEDGNQIEVDVDLRASVGDYAQVLYVDQTGMRYDSSTQTAEEYQAQLYQAGLEALSQYSDVTSVTFDTIDRGVKYLTDYDIGDKCDVVLDSVQMSFTVRIIEIQETFKQSQHIVTLQFGEKIPTVYNKARR